MSKGYSVASRLNKDGKKSYHVRVRYKDYPTVSRTFKTKTRADRFGQKTVHDLDAGTYVSKGAASKTVTLNEAFEKFIDALPEKTHTQRIYKKNHLSYSNIVRQSEIGKLKLGNIRKSHMAKFRDQRLKVGSAQTVKNNMHGISRVYKKAISDWDISVENPVTGVERPQAPPPRDRRLEVGEMELILEEARKLTKQPWVAPLIEFLIYSAFRLGEACRIRPKDVLWSTREVFMQTRKGGKVDIKVPVPQCASDVLKAFEPSWRMDAVFHVTPNQASSVLGKFHQNLLLRGVIEKPLRTHDYRHEGTSRLFELKNDSGQPLLTVPFIVLYTGHSSIDVLVKTYANVRNEDANKVLDTVGY